MKLDASVN